MESRAIVAPRAGLEWLRHGATALVLELRCKQWIKNLACFAGLIFSGQLFSAEAALQAVLGFAMFCLASSATYILNDLVDLERDRRNPRTATRPLAAGDLPVWFAVVVGCLLMAIAGWGSFLLNGACLGLLVAYGVLNLLYSLRLKHTVIADVICISLGFLFRVLYGVYAVGSQPTAWIVLCMFFLAMFLGIAKRKAEWVRFGHQVEDIRPVLGKYHGGYLDLMVGLFAALTIMSYALFATISQKNPTLVVTVVPVVYCIARYMLHVIIDDNGQSPENILLTDQHMWVGICSWLCLCVAILYSNVPIFVEVEPSVRPAPTAER